MSVTRHKFTYKLIFTGAYSNGAAVWSDHLYVSIFAYKMQTYHTLFICFGAVFSTFFCSAVLTVWFELGNGVRMRTFCRSFAGRRSLIKIYTYFVFFNEIKKNYSFFANKANIKLKFCRKWYWQHEGGRGCRVYEASNAI